MTHSLTYNDMLGAYDAYPAPIRPYLLRAETHPELRSQLTKSFMRVFVDVLARAPIADPLRPLKLRIDIIAENLGISTRTVDRALGFFKRQGWLAQDRQCDGRNNFGEFCAKEFILGAGLRHLIGLPTEALPPKNQQTPSVGKHFPTGKTLLNPVDNPSSATKMSHGAYRVNNVFKKEASFQKEASSLKNQNPKTGSSPEPELPQTLPSSPQPKLPDDLSGMAEDLSIHPIGICSLMRLAKRHNQRLQDVWLVKREQLMTAGVREGRAFRYLQFLLNTGEDFAWRVRQMITGTNGAGYRPAPACKDTGDVRHYWNKKYTDGVQRVHIHGDGTAELYRGSVYQSYICPKDMPPVYEAIRRGKLRAVTE